MKCRTFENYEELVADYEEGNLHPGDLKPSLSKAINKILQVIAISVLIKLVKVEFDIAQPCTICSLILCTWLKSTLSSLAHLEWCDWNLTWALLLETDGFDELSCFCLGFEYSVHSFGTVVNSPCIPLLLLHPEVKAYKEKEKSYKE